MSTLTILLLACSLALITAQYWVAGQPKLGRAKDALTSLVNLMTTAAGVLLAIAITLHYQEKDDVEKVTARLGVALNEISYIDSEIRHLKNGGVASATLPMPVMVHELVTSDLVARHVDEFTVYLLAQVNSDISRVSAEYTEAVLSDGSIFEKLRQYELLMQQYGDTLRIEFCYKAGRVGLDDRTKLIAGLQAHKISTLVGGGVLAEQGADAYQKAIAAGCLIERESDIPAQKPTRAG